MTDKATDQFVTLEQAGWALFHPVDLRARHKHPPYWWDHGFAVAKEFSRGSLIAVVADLPGPTLACCRVGSLTDRERAFLVDSAVFRYRVRYSMAFFANLDDLPCDRGGGRAIEPDQMESVALPNGLYRVTVHTIAWAEEGGSIDEAGQRTPNALPDYVIAFEPVEDFDSIAIAGEIPHLMVADEPSPVPRSTNDPDDFVLAPPYPFVLLTDQVPLPGVAVNLKLPPEANASLLSAMDREDWSIVVAVVDSCPGIGVVFSVDAVAGDMDGTNVIEVSGVGGPAVLIKGFAQSPSGWFVDVAPLSDPTSVDDERRIVRQRGAWLSRLKRFFLRLDAAIEPAYDMTIDPYETAEKIELERDLKKRFIALIRQEGYPYPDFAAERIKAIDSLPLLTYTVADEIGFDASERLSLLKLPTDVERAKMVLKRLFRLNPSCPS